MNSLLTKKYKNGLILGKFMPPHRGHEFLINFGLQYVEHLTVIIDHPPNEWIPGTIRLEWLKKLFAQHPNIEFKYIDITTPQQPEEHPNFWNFWNDVLYSLCPKMDCLIASTDYAPRLAQELKVPLVECDTNRNLFPISATQIRSNIYENWDFLISTAKSNFVKKIAFLGPESSGKTTTANYLSQREKAAVVPEYAHNYLMFHPELQYSDMVEIIKGQKNGEIVMTGMGNKLLICDSEAITTKVWSQVLFQKADPLLDEVIQQDDYQHYFLFTPEVQWVADQHRNCLKEPANLHLRWDFFHRMENELKKFGKPYSIIDGEQHADRVKKTYDVYDNLKIFK